MAFNIEALNSANGASLEGVTNTLNFLDFFFLFILIYNMKDLILTKIDVNTDFISELSRMEMMVVPECLLSNFRFISSLTYRLFHVYPWKQSEKRCGIIRLV